MHPIDGRYRVADLEQYFSDDALLKYILKIELAHIKALERRGICAPEVYEKITERASQITADMWNEKQEDPKYKHNIRALMALINEDLPENMQRFFHLGLTSYDVVDNANIIALKDATYDIVIPDSLVLGNVLLHIAGTYMEGTQVGRTHGQHAEPTTFGREVAVWADRWCDCVEHIKYATNELRGKIAGAIGTKASLMLIGDADEIEKEVLDSVGLKPARIATQILPPEQTVRYYSELEIGFGVLHDIANNMCQLARTEIGEYALDMPEGQGRSSTMPHKGLSEQGKIVGNPEDFENLRGQYDAAVSLMQSAFRLQKSEHNRDLSNSSLERYVKAGIIVPFVYSVRRLKDTMMAVQPNVDVMEGRVANAWHLLMEPAYIALALNGESNPQGYVRDALKKYGTFKTVLEQDETVKRAIAALSPERQKIFESPSNYIGKSERQTGDVFSYWSQKIPEIRKSLESR